jgi:hypothetical protein
MLGLRNSYISTVICICGCLSVHEQTSHDLLFAALAITLTGLSYCMAGGKISLLKQLAGLHCNAFM